MQGFFPSFYNFSPHSVVFMFPTALYRSEVLGLKPLSPRSYSTKTYAFFFETMRTPHKFMQKKVTGDRWVGYIYKIFLSRARPSMCSGVHTRPAVRDFPKSTVKYCHTVNLLCNYMDAIMISSLYLLQKYEKYPFAAK